MASARSQEVSDTAQVGLTVPWAIPVVNSTLLGPACSPELHEPDLSRVNAEVIAETAPLHSKEASGKYT